MTSLENHGKIVVTLIATLLLLSLVGNSNQIKSLASESTSMPYVSCQTYEYHEAIEINGDGELLSQAAAEGWPGSGTPSDPIIISGYYFNATHVQPVRLWNLELSWEFRNNYLTTFGVICGVWVQGAKGGVVAENVLVECHGGIILDGQDILIENNSISNNTGTGIEVFGTASNLEIRNNTIYGVGGDGMKLPGLTTSIVEGNSIIDSGMNGIKLSSASHHNEIRENDIRLNGYYGIRCPGYYNTFVGNAIGYNKMGICLISTTASVSSGSYNNITGNSIINNTGLAIDIRPNGNHNKISNNDFIQNGETFQICDNGTDNEFLNNYYNEWFTPDEDSDGFVDEPYSIEGNANSVDEFPRAEPANPIPEWCIFEPLTPTTSLTETTTSEPPPSLPMMEIALALGGGLVVALLVIVVIRKRG